MTEIFDKIKVEIQNYISKLDSTNNANSTIVINLNGSQAEMEGNIDSFRNTQKNIPNKYELIKEILNEYRISPTEAEQYGLLEKIAGCEKGELQKMSEEEFNVVVKALREALGITGHWKLIWENRNLEDIEKIATDANKRYISQKTGGNWLQQKWFDLTTKSELIKELKSEGISINNESELDTAIKTYVQNNYFNGLTPEELKNKYSVDKINEFYDNALRGFGNLLNKYNSQEDKTIITSIIEMLRADQRNLAANVALKSCQNNIETKEVVAVSIDSKALYIAGKKDAFGAQMTQEENIELRTTVYDNMNKKENREASYARIKEVAEEYQELIKKEQESTLTDSEKARLAELKELNVETLYVIGGYSAAKISASKRVANGEPDIITELVNLEKDTVDLGYQEEVIETVASYIKNNQEALNMTEEDFKKLMDEVTDGNYSQILNNTTPNTALNTPPSNKNVNTYTSIQQNSTDSTTQNLGFNTKETPKTLVTKTNIDNLYKTVEENLTTKNNTKEEENEITSASKINKYFETYGSIKGFKEYQKEHGFLVAITETLNNAKDTGALTSATESFKRRDCSQQINIIKRLFSEGLNIALNNAKQGTMERLENITLNTFAATKQAKKAVEEKLNA